MAVGAGGEVMLFAAGEGMDANNWTAFGLLGTVLVAIGFFLRWYLPTQSDNFLKAIQSQQQSYEASLREQRLDFLKTIDTLRQAYEAQVKRETEMLERVYRKTWIDEIQGEPPGKSSNRPAARTPIARRPSDSSDPNA